MSRVFFLSLQIKKEEKTENKEEETLTNLAHDGT